MQNPNFLTGQAGLSFNGYPVFNTVGSNGAFNVWFNSFDEVKWHNENYQYVDGTTLGNPNGWNKNMPKTGYYNVEHWVALQIALRKGVPNAQQAITRFQQAVGIGDINVRQGFAITFSGGSPGSSIRAPFAPTNVRIVP
jgi:hypothetical protein